MADKPVKFTASTFEREEDAARRVGFKNPAKLPSMFRDFANLARYEDVDGYRYMARRDVDEYIAGLQRAQVQMQVAQRLTQVSKEASVWTGVVAGLAVITSLAALGVSIFAAVS